MLRTRPFLEQGESLLNKLPTLRELYAQDRYDRASRYYLKALEARPDRPEIYWSLGSAYEAVAELTLAEQSYRDAIRVDPSYPRSYFSLGTMLLDSIGGKRRSNSSRRSCRCGKVILNSQNSRRVGSRPARNGW